MSTPEVITVAKADWSHRPDDAPHDAILAISSDLPEWEYNDNPNWMSEYDKFYTSQANTIVNFLERRLPQATLERVMIEMCRRQSILWRVPFGKPATP